MDPVQGREPGRRGSAFVRVGVTAAAACVLAASIAGLGATGLLANTGGFPVAAAAQHPAASSQPAVPKATITAADLAAFAASPYAHDALNLAAVWNVDLRTARGTAGAKIQAGVDLPFAAADAASKAYSPEQQNQAFFTGGADFEQALGLAIVWGSADMPTAKTKIGGLLLAHRPVPSAPTTYTEAEQATAFTLVGYGDAEAARLAALWQTDSHGAKVRAGAALLAGSEVPL